MTDVAGPRPSTWDGSALIEHAARELVDRLLDTVDQLDDPLARAAGVLRYRQVAKRAVELLNLEAAVSMRTAHRRDKVPMPQIADHITSRAVELTKSGVKYWIEQVDRVAPCGEHARPGSDRGTTDIDPFPAPAGVWAPCPPPPTQEDHIMRRLEPHHDHTGAMRQYGDWHNLMDGADLDEYIAGMVDDPDDFDMDRLHDDFVARVNELMPDKFALAGNGEIIGPHDAIDAWQAARAELADAIAAIQIDYEAYER